MPEWNHKKTFLALLEQTEERGGRNTYVRLYPQKQNCAILYSDNATKAFRENPLHFKGPDHLREGAKKDWNQELFEQLQHFIIKPDYPDKNKFYWYGVSDWNGFAKALKAWESLTRMESPST